MFSEPCFRALFLRSWVMWAARSGENAGRKEEGRTQGMTTLASGAQAAARVASRYRDRSARERAPRPAQMRTTIGRCRRGTPSPALRAGRPKSDPRGGRARRAPGRLPRQAHRTPKMSCRVNTLSVTLKVDQSCWYKPAHSFCELESKAEVPMQTTVIPLHSWAYWYGVCRCGRGVAPVGR